MDLLITSIAELRKYVKINNSKSFDTYQMFIADAQDRYITPYVGDKLPPSGDPLREYLCRALGPFSLALATDEFSINFGETGHTVLRNDQEAPASDAKIERAEESLLERAWENLDKAINYIQGHSGNYPEAIKVINAYNTSLFKSAKELQEFGLISINNSSLTFFHLRMLIIRIEKTETFRLLPKEARDKYANASIPERIKSAMQAYTGSRLAMLHTSVKSREERGTPGTHASRPEYKPIIRPLYDDHEHTGNYYADQVEFWRSELHDALVENGDTQSSDLHLNYNTKDSKIFVANSRRYEDNKDQ